MTIFIIKEIVIYLYNKFGKDISYNKSWGVIAKKHMIR